MRLASPFFETPADQDWSEPLPTWEPRRFVNHVDSCKKQPVGIHRPVRFLGGGVLDDSPLHPKSLQRLVVSNRK